MFKQSLLILLGVLLGYIGGLTAVGHTEGLRLEASVGQCKYGKANDGSWYKNGYSQTIDLNTRCASLGASQTIWPTPWGLLGWRAAYVDFGTASADTFVPVVDAEANSFPSGQNCNQQTYSGCVGQFKQWGRARGVTFGPILENKIGPGTLGLEGGLFRYTSYWRVQGTIPGPSTCASCFGVDTSDWNGAKGVHWTWYAGLTYEISGFFLQMRRYHATYASQARASNNPLAIGLIAGPLYSVMVGYQWSFQ